jgi:phosphate transport system permease protein
MNLKRNWQPLVIVWAWSSAFTLFGAVTVIIGFLLSRGARTLNMALIFGNTAPLDALLLRKPVFNGLLPAIVGTLLLVVLAVGMAFPVGLATGIYLAEYARGKIKTVLSLLFDVLAGIPSIVIGLFGFSLAVFLHRHLCGRIYPCLLISALALAFLVLPYLIRSTQTALESLPVQIRIIAPALGATKLQNICHVLLPGTLQTIMSGVILAIGRCAEDTAVIMLTGAVATAGMPGSLLNSYEALPFYIYYISSQYADPEELLRGYGAAILLLLICLFLFGLSKLIQKMLTARLDDRRFLRND